MSRVWLGPKRISRMDFEPKGVIASTPPPPLGQLERWPPGRAKSWQRVEHRRQRHWRLPACVNVGPGRGALRTSVAHRDAARHGVAHRRHRSRCARTWHGDARGIAAARARPAGRGEAPRRQSGALSEAMRCRPGRGEMPPLERSVASV